MQGRDICDNEQGNGLTWLVQTLLNVTNANVWASIVPGRSFLPRMRGIRTTARSNCGMKAKDSKLPVGLPCPLVGSAAAVRYRRVLYGEKLCRWSMRVK